MTRIRKSSFSLLDVENHCGPNSFQSSTFKFCMKCHHIFKHTQSFFSKESIHHLPKTIVGRKMNIKDTAFTCM